MEAENVTPIRQDGQQQPRTVTLPATRAALTWDRATDALVAAAEDVEATAKAKYESAKAEYQAARQNAHMIRQLRQLARVAGAPEAAPVVPARRGTPGLGGRWARGFDACINCQTTRIKHAAKGRCMTCASHFQRTGEERPIREAQNHE